MLGFIFENRTTLWPICGFILQFLSIVNQRRQQERQTNNNNNTTTKRHIKVNASNFFYFNGADRKNNKILQVSVWATLKLFDCFA